MFSKLDNIELGSESPSAEEAALSADHTAWMRGAGSTQSDRAVSANEVTSLSALIAYVAYQSGENEFGVARRLSDRFNVANVICLPTT